MNPSKHPLLPLGAMAAGFGLLGVNALAQPVIVPPETTLPAVSVRESSDDERNSTRATTSSIVKGTQELRDIPQSLTVITERLIHDRQLDTLKAALHNTAGVTFLAGEGGEEDIRLRGFSLATTGDIFVDGMRDPAFYDRDTFANERVELLRGSASMLFGRGSTGGVVNQVTKQANLLPSNEVLFSLSSGDQARLVGDFNRPTGPSTGLRIQTMVTKGDDAGIATQKAGVAVNWRQGIGQRDEWSVGLYHLDNANGIHYGIPWLQGRPVNVDPRNYYGAASDINRGTASYVTLTQRHRFADDSQLTTTLRQGRYTRDQRASAIRFFVNNNPANGPIVNAPTRDNVGPGTLLNRGSNNKVQDLGTTYLQSDYSSVFGASGLKHEVLAGLDAARERFRNFALSVPAGVVLDKNQPRTNLGTPNDGTGVDESLRIKTLQRAFKADGVGAYAQDLVSLTPTWKLLGGLRLDRFSGDFRTPATATAAEVTRSRGDSLWSRRAGLLYQPDKRHSFHFSYGTSFNTSGDTYQYDNQTDKTPPESSQNLELGATLDSADDGATLRVAIFRSTKLHERNRDPDSAAVQNLLSGRRHSAGVELDLSGRITPEWEVFGSYAWVPVARIDVGAPGATPGVGEGAGTRSSLTPKHSGTIWSTYQLDHHWRMGGGVNLRSAQTPNRNPVGVRAPGFATLDLIAEYSLEQVAFKFNVGNLTNRLYADSLYTAHYIPGAGRTLSFTVATRF